MSLKNQITEAMKSALRAGDKPRLGVLRLALAAIKQREIDERIVLDDAQVLAVLEKMLKQRRDSLAQFQAAQRADLAAQEQYEISQLETWLPAPLSESELEALLAAAIAATGASGARDMGKVMAALKPQVAGRADMTALSARVKARLG
ncbi:MAG: GatB/YqeY domain-containing protein [Proteobacteria bacterium]|nr:GatB/YqeY domain-containing protein [Pseudomonadota bacterium]